MSADDPPFDPGALLAALDQHEVTYLLVGGFAAQVHGAHRQTMDLDVVPRTTEENLRRLAATLAELNARLRVGGLSDEEAKQLPVVLDAATLRSFGSSTWMTDAGPIDVLVELRDAAGGRHPYEDLASRVVVAKIDELQVHLASLPDIIASKEFAGRAKDHDALPELRALVAQTDGPPKH
ncbi:MAG: nucleotidyl transferase AbiEii/AbiGii toxin family protein [Acidimicrobiales bacterium]